MGGAGVDLLRPADLLDGFGGANDRARGVHNVVEQDAGLAVHVADDVHDLGLVGALAALVHNGHVDAELHGEGAGAGGAAHVRGDDHHLFVALAEHVDKMLDEQVPALEVVHGDIEEALDLGGVQVHGQKPVGPGGGDEVCHQLCGDGVAALGLAVLAGVAEIGDDGGDAPGGGPAHGVDHDKQLHEIVVDVVAGGLDDEHILAAHRLKHRDRALAVGKLGDVRIAKRSVQRRTDGLGQSGVGVPGEDLDFLAMRDHISFSSVIRSRKSYQ